MRRPSSLLLCLSILLVLSACGPAGDPAAPTLTPDSMPQFAGIVGKAAATASIDIKPGSCPNPLNPASMGKLPVAIAGNGALDALDIDPSSILLEGVPPLRYSVEDVTQQGGCCDLTPIYRVNAGGVAVLASPSWTADTEGNPSPYVNTGFVASTIEPVDVSHPSIPAGTPLLVFQSERWDFSNGADMRWEFPVDPGSYTVRLYFAESYSRNMQVGARVFDVGIEGELVLDDYDIFATVGARAGIVEEFEREVLDGSLSIEFGHEVQSPNIAAIEILGNLGAPQPDGIDDLVLKFDTQAVVAAMGQLTPDAEYRLTLTGALFDGATFSDDECVKLVGNPAMWGSPGAGRSRASKEGLGAN